MPLSTTELQSLISRAIERANDGRSHPYGSQHAAAAFSESAAMANIALAVAASDLLDIIAQDLGLKLEILRDSADRRESVIASLVPPPEPIDFDKHEAEAEAAVDIFAEARASSRKPRT